MNIKFKLPIRLISMALTILMIVQIGPTNSGWFQPQKFVSSFVGKYAVKSELQSLAQGGLLFGYEGLKYSVGQRMQGQQPTITFFPDTEIRAAG